MSRSEPLQETLEKTPTRVVSFLNAIARNPTIFAALTQRGYTQEDHSQGVELLQKVTALPLPTGNETNNSVAKAAIVELDQWDEPHFRMASAALRRLHPDQGEFIFADLEADTGYGAAVAVTTFLDRLDALESSEDRTDTREADAAALSTLAARGINADERRRLRALIAQANTVPTLTPSDIQARQVAHEEARHRHLLDLYNWHNDWATTARAFIKRRDHRIALGLASRRKRKAPDNNP